MGFGRYLHNMRIVPKGTQQPHARDKVAFVLSGGGVLGSIQVGQLEALRAAGIQPDFYVAASVGGLNAATVAADADADALARLREVWTSLRTEDLFPGSRVQRAWHFVRRGDHLYANTGIRRLIDMIPVRRFEQMHTPLSVVAANLRTGREQWFETGPITPAILASSALPGIFPPVLVDGELYVDGGVVNNVPISRAVALGATTVYVLTCGAPQTPLRPINRPLDVLMQAVAHSRAARVEVDMSRFAREAQILMVPVPDTGYIRFNDLTHTERLIDEARDATSGWLASARVDAVT
ncbi:MAG TPA: patatin-like phospholipase family protein [Actinomycetota bacterium]|nr:patatin-like phospholipase family protein [Actinomycetota bacterium]